MILAAMIAFQLAACGLILLVVRYELRRSKRILDASAERAMAELQAFANSDKSDYERIMGEVGKRFLPPPARMGTFPPPIEVVELKSQDELAGKPIPPPAEVIPPGRVNLGLERHERSEGNGHPRVTGDLNTPSVPPAGDANQPGAP
jgi:hypothetical protein